jgi:ABC-type branched-subunit amino acid transport system substrate-binding protein
MRGGRQHVRSSPIARIAWQICAISALVATAGIFGCMTGPRPKPKLPPPPPPPAVAQYRPGHALNGEEPGFLRLGNMPSGSVPVRVGILLPFSNGSSATRELAASMMKAAEMALFDSGKRNILLLSADEGSGGPEAAAGARKLLAEGAEIIVGPLFAPSVSAVAPIARDHAVPVIAFSTDRAVGGGGVYLLSFQPENQVRRIVSYAVAQGHRAIAALVPRTAYGTRVIEAFRESVAASGAQVADLETYVPETGAIGAPAHAVAAAHPAAILIAQGGALLRDLAATLATDGEGSQQVQYLGTGLWDDSQTKQEPDLAGAWYAAPDPEAERAFESRYRDAYASDAPPLAALAYDAVSLVSLLSSGPAYHRFTRETLTDPNGFSGIDGIFRFAADGSSEQGLAVLKIEPGSSPVVVSPAPRTFEQPRS